MGHITTEAGEALLEKEMKVLDKGFVRLVDYMGSDARIVQSARVSYGAGTKSVREDKGLIDYLLRNHHMSPFEQVVFTFHLKMPIFVARQLVRHRTARMNEISGRYSKMLDEFYTPAAEDIRFQSKSNRQGRSADDVPTAQREKVLATLKNAYETAYQGYGEMIEADIARELARVSLPLSLYTEMYWQIDLRNLLHFIKLRLDSHAQYEIRVYADKMAEAVKAVTPFTWESFQRHEVGAVKLNRDQVERIQEAIGETHEALLAELGLQKK